MSSSRIVVIRYVRYNCNLNNTDRVGSNCFVKTTSRRKKSMMMALNTEHFFADLLSHPTHVELIHTFYFCRTPTNVNERVFFGMMY